MDSEQMLPEAVVSRQNITDEHPEMVSRMDSLTQDCVGWDESKNLDLRKLADPTFQTPRHLLNDEDETPVSSSTESMKTAPRRQSLDAVTRHLPHSVSAVRNTAAEQEIRHIFQQIGNAKENNADDSLKLVHANSSSAASSCPTVSDAGVFAVAGSRKRQRREQHPKPAAVPTKSITNIPQRRNIQPSMQQPHQPVGNSTEFDDLLNQIQTPPPGDGDSSSKGPLATNTNHVARPQRKPLQKVGLPVGQKTAAVPQQPIVNKYQQRPPMHGVNTYKRSQQKATGQQTRVIQKAKPVNNCAIQTVKTNQATVTAAMNLPPRQGTQNSSRAAPIVTSSNDDEFGDLEFSLDDFAAIDSLVVAATQQNASSQSQVENHHSGARRPPPTRETVHNAAQPENRSSKEHVLQKPTSEEEDPFGDFPDIDFDALDKAVQAEQPMQQKHSINEEDPFGDFSDVDFDAIDKAVEAHMSSSQTNRQRIVIPPQSAPVCNPRRLRATQSNEPSFLTFSRYKVLHVDDDLSTWTRTLTVATWTAEMLQEDERASKAFHSHSDAYGRIRDPGSDKVWTTAGVIHLCGEWYHTRVMEGDNIHICSLKGQFRTDETALPLVLHTSPPSGSDSDDLVMIVHPDMLLTPTIISETVSCTRRAILKNRLGSTGLTSRAAVFGTMRHELFEETMKNQDFSSNAAVSHIQNITKQHAEDLLSCNISTAEAEKEIIKVLPQLQHFANEYTEFGQIQGPRNIGQSAVLESQWPNLPPTRFIAKAAEAIEEPVISPELGLKGNVDMLVRAMTATNDPNVAQQVATSFMGIELKTGHNQRSHNAHIAQLALYILMMQTRYGTRYSNSDTLASADSGVLLYMNNEAVRAVEIAPMMSDTKSLIVQRNVVATEQVDASRPRGVRLSYENDDSATEKKMARFDLLEPGTVKLPDLLPNSYSCKKCYTNRECMMYAAAARSSRKIAEGDPSHQELMRHFTGHLADEDYAYFAEWDRLVDLEAHAHDSSVATSWLLGSDFRESEFSKSISSLVYDPTISSPEAVFDETWYSIIGFRRSPAAVIQTPLSNTGFAPGCRVIVSTDSTTLGAHSQNSRRPKIVRPQMHIVRGVVHATTDAKLCVRASRDDLGRILKIVMASGGDHLKFRLDRDDSATGIGTLRQNLINLFTADVKPVDQQKSVVQGSRLSRLRDFIVRLREPMYDSGLVKSMFSPTTETSSCVVPGCDLMDLVVEYADMNPDQRAAAEKVISAKDYTLIQGLPGTGKTSTIAFVARLLAARGQRVLITSYTHAAVDNVLLKLIEKGVASKNRVTPLPALLRIGRKSSCHPTVHSILANTIAAGIEVDAADTAAEKTTPSAESLRRVVSSARIVGVTALTVPRSPLLVAQEFDVVILDEAGQISQPASLGALMAANTFVLAGDHMQLPPLVVSESAGQGDFGVSMLKRLADKHHDSVVQLTYQYRMHEDICQLSNDIVYKGKLKCADKSVAKKKLSLDGFPENLPYIFRGESAPWLNQALDPASAVVFLNTDAIKDPSRNDVPGSIHPLERSTGREIGGSIVNDTEVSLVRTVVGGLLACGTETSSIGVICPFRAQLRMLEDCSLVSKWKNGGLEISTIDRYQGRDKDVIVLSFVRSNVKGKVGRLLSDFRRLNVAVTRAKCKLIMIGSYSTLYNGSDVLKPALERVKDRGGVLQLPENATQCYSI